MTKKQFSGALDVLGLVDPYGVTDEQTGSEALVTLELDACRPDPDQPRHVLPGDLRERVLEGATPAEVLWEAWERCLGEELYGALRSHDLSPAEALIRRREEGALDLALQLTLEGLADLAGSIVRHGLRHPLNVYDLGGGRYRLAEGERRWWAHVLLRDALLRVEAATIPARVHPLPGDALAVLARQQAENAHRRDLSAIARARAIARVREAVAEAVPGTTGSWESGGDAGDALGTTGSWESGSGGEGDALGTSGSWEDGGEGEDDTLGTSGSWENGGGAGNALGTIGSWEEPVTIAPGKNDLDDLTGERLAGLTGRGMSGRMVRYYLALLTLPSQARELAEAAGLAERALRPIVALDDPAGQVRLVHALAAGEMTPAQVAAEVKRIKSPKAPKQQAKDPLARGVAGLRASLRAARDLPDPALLAGRITRLPPRKRDDLLDQARTYAAFLQAVLRAIEEQDESEVGVEA